MPRRLSFLTWNVCLAEAGHQVSARAPAHFWVPDKCRWIRTEVQRADPDVVCLQELPLDSKPWAPLVQPLLNWLGSRAPYVSAGPPVKTHQGLTALWVRASLQPRSERAVPPVALASVPLALLPGASAGDSGSSSIASAAATCRASDASADSAVAAADASGGELVYLLGAHCIFGDGRGAKRVEQLERALSTLPPGARCVVLAGDTNLRGDHEDEEAARVTGLTDAALALGLGEQWTWDPAANPYFRKHQKEPDDDDDDDSPHSPTAFRFDRVYASPAVRPAGLRLVGTQEVTLDHGHCLSDHYGLLALLQLPDPVPPGLQLPAAGEGPPAASGAAAGQEPPLKRQRRS